MKQEVEVLTIYEIGKRDSKPIRFKLVENGIQKTIKVFTKYCLFLRLYGFDLLK